MAATTGPTPLTNLYTRMTTPLGTVGRFQVTPLHIAATLLIAGAIFLIQQIGSYFANRQSAQKKPDTGSSAVPITPPTTDAIDLTKLRQELETTIKKQEKEITHLKEQRARAKKELVLLRKEFSELMGLIPQQIAAAEKRGYNKVVAYKKVTALKKEIIIPCAAKMN
ncbi:hypothetical protein K0U07_05930, partial [bacterium]|nr:hypothetical protein [bacterium]